MSRKDFLKEMVDALDDLFTEIKYLKTSQEDKADTLLPLLIITTVDTRFDKSGTRQYREFLTMNLTIVLQETSNPLFSLAEKEEAVIGALLTNSRLKQFAQDFKVLKTTASNTVNQYQKQGAISSELQIEALFAVSY